MLLELEMIGESELLAGISRPTDMCLLIICLVDIPRNVNESTALNY